MAGRLTRRTDQIGVIGQAQVVIGTEVQYRLAAGYLDQSALLRGDNTLILVEPLRFYLTQLLLGTLVEFSLCRQYLVPTLVPLKFVPQPLPRSVQTIGANAFASRHSEPTMLRRSESQCLFAAICAQIESSSIPWYSRTTNPR